MKAGVSADDEIYLEDAFVIAEWQAKLGQIPYAMDWIDGDKPQQHQDPAGNII